MFMKVVSKKNAPVLKDEGDLNVFTTETIYLLQLVAYQCFKCFETNTRYK